MRKNSNIILNKKPKFQVYVAEGLRIYSDVENEQVKSDSIVNKVLTFFNNKTGNQIAHILKSGHLRRNLNKTQKDKMKNIFDQNFLS